MDGEEESGVAVHEVSTVADNLITFIAHSRLQRYLFLHEDSVSDVPHRNKSNADNFLPLEGFRDLFPKLVFIVLIDDPANVSTCGTEVIVNYHVHLYGGITAMDLIIASCTRSPAPISMQLSCSPWYHLQRHAFSEPWVPGDGEPSDDERIWYFRIRGMTLHNQARFLEDDNHPIEVYKGKDNETIPFEWRFDEPVAYINSYNNSSTMNFRHLNIQDAGWEETLQRCVWLMQINGNCSPGAAVSCRSEMVLPLIQTVSFDVSRF